MVDNETIKNPILKLEGLTKTFPGTVALDSVDFELLEGEVHALVGQNGAGKSTLVKILAGIYAQDKGEIRVAGRVIDHLTPKISYNLGLRFIHQELKLVPQFNAAENVVLGDPYPCFLGTRLINWSALNKRVAQLFRELSIDLNPRSSIQELTFAEKWLIAIARAFYSRGRILVLDEPTSSLTGKEVEILFDLIKKLRAKGTAVIYISHRLEEVFELTDRITVLRDGQKVGTYSAEAVDLSTLVKYMVGRETQKLYPSVVPMERKESPVLEIRRLTTEDGRLRGVSFDVRAGEVVGLGGLLGAGQTDIAHLLFGIERSHWTGSIALNGKPYRPHSTAHAIRNRLALVPEERHSQGLVLNMGIHENVILPSLSRFIIAPILPLLNHRKIRRITEDQIASLNIKATTFKQEVASLSGGTQQKVVLAKWLLREPRLFIMNDPTRGIDIATKAELYRLVRKLAASGSAILFISSDMEELAGVCDRVLVMYKGALAGELKGENLIAHKIMEYCYTGAAASQVTQ